MRFWLAARRSGKEIAAPADGTRRVAEQDCCG